MKQPGNPWPLGANLVGDGVNFSVFSPQATKIELLLFKDVNDFFPEVITLNPTTNKTYYYWHIWIPGLNQNQLYAYRAYGPYAPEKGFLFDDSKVLVDPYAKAIVGNYDRETANIRGKDNLHSCLKSAVICDDFDWDAEYYPKHDLAKSVIYELHVAGFTKNLNSGVSENIRGTYSGLVEKIPYLKELGITAVELLPVYAFDDQDAPPNLKNYWGYSPINFFAVHSNYASKQMPQDVVDEFKHMIKAFHLADIEVILDVVYNHTTENDAHNDGPTLCMRGFANESYYMLDEQGDFRNFTGTGNTLNANHSVVRRMIKDSLLYWVEEMHIDGFRFDLASVLSRNESGEPLLNPPILWSIDSDPVLSSTKIIAEPWDAAGLNQVMNFAGDRWIIWNDGFRDTIRKFVRGDDGVIGELAKRMLGSQHEIKARHAQIEPNQNLHFITCHDGFTMYDLVSYNEKHNWANGEENRDGSNNNYSWNCGVEGSTENVEIQKLRAQQIRNFYSLLLLSHGTPMLLMGDEMMRTQNGNNNVYCQDNPLSWMNWDLMEKNIEMVDFVSHLIKYTQKHRTFSHSTYYENKANREIPYVDFHGIKLNQPDWGHFSKSLAYEIIAPVYDEHFYIIMNMYHENLEFELPQQTWEHIFNTEIGFNKIDIQCKVNCPARTVMCLKAI